MKSLNVQSRAELHAHLNGSIPIAVLQELARDYPHQISSTGPASQEILITSGIETLLRGPSLDTIGDFFGLFPAIYALTDSPSALARATRAVLETFLDGVNPQCTYLELRTTPKETASMTREQYLKVVLTEANLISVLAECIRIAAALKLRGERIVGVDLCGDPTAGDAKLFRKHFAEAKEAGLGVTLHIAETTRNTPEETIELLSFNPDRLGHATFLNSEAKELVLQNKTCIEICLSSNLLCKTVTTLDSHHIRFYLKHNHPIAICTDDILPFRTSLEAEYALLLAPPPLGLGLAQEEVRVIAEASLENRMG
ncbi:hypothetical protein BD779DRAFT_1612839 [Infundibulicybe gibba]|nr:hypothetical protein BD779DRAFT_1612839 [Infundibulicybe gibba]